MCKRQRFSRAVFLKSSFAAIIDKRNSVIQTVA